MSIPTDLLKYMERPENKPAEAILRLKKLDDFLDNVEDKDVPDRIIRKINAKFPKTRNCDFIRTEQIEIGMRIKYVDLRLESISPTCIVEDKIDTTAKKEWLLMLLDTSSNEYKRINPDKFYLFVMEKNRGVRRTNMMRKFLKETIEGKTNKK